jgi:hypothetical protein
VEENYQGLKEQLRSQRSEGLWEAYQEVANRQAHFQDSLLGVDDALQELEAQAGQTLLAHVGALHQEVDQLGENLWQDAAVVLEEQAGRLEALEAANQTAQLQQLQRAQQRTQRAQQRTQRAQQRSQREQQRSASHSRLAAQALQAAGVVLEALAQADLLPEAQAEIEEHSLSLQMAQDNLADGMYEAALAGAQRAYIKLSGLRRRHEAAAARREALRQAALERLELLQEKTRRQAQTPAIGLDGEILDLAIDVEWWSGGRLSALNSRLAGLKQQIAGAALWEAELLAVHNQSLPMLEEELEAILYHARREVLASQLRYNIAACVVDALREQGFEVQAGGYQERDMRGGYRAVVQHLDGSEVMLQVSGETGEVGRSQLDLYSLDRGMRTAHELRQRVKEMAASLRARGLEVGQREEREDSRTGAAQHRSQYTEQPGYVATRRE